MQRAHPASPNPAGEHPDDAAGCEAYFHELDAWTEYWDIYHPESNGRYYFGSEGASGLLELIVPRHSTPPVFEAWKRHALGLDKNSEFSRCARSEPVRAAVGEFDDLVAGIFERHFGDPSSETVRHAYLRSMLLFATDRLPPATERYDRIPENDPRKRTAGRHTIDADMMWFVWALVLEAARLNGERRPRASLHALLLAGVATGCAANFAWRGHRRTRAEYYAADEAAEALLLDRGLAWARDPEAATAEIHVLYRIREGSCAESGPG